MKNFMAKTALSALIASATLAPIAALSQSSSQPMTLNVDATDTDRGIFSVKQRIPVTKSGPLKLQLPKWLPGNHAPRGEIEKIAGLVIKANGKTLTWKRDSLDVYAFAVDVPEGTKTLDVAFQFLSATAEDQGRIVMTDSMMNVQWNSVSLYPSGIAVSDIPVSATITYPKGWKAGTALRPASVVGDTVTYQTVNYETLIDSPVFAGLYFRKEDLGNNVSLNIVADSPKNLEAKPVHIEAHRKLVDQALKVFGTRQFDHYDFLLALTDKMGSIGLEHHRSSENGVNPEYFTDWDSGPGRRNLLPHELVHSWDGKHRRPLGQKVNDYATPVVNDLLWVYEGQTQFWGYVLGARSGLFSKQETLDAYASIAAGLNLSRGRDWRSLDDTTNDPVISARRPKGWTSWQRSEDYYNEGMLVWLEVDAIMRAKTAGAKGIDNFARLFFGTKEGDYSANHYDFNGLVSALNATVPYDWAAFLNQRLTEKAAGAPLNGLVNGGYRLTFGDEPTPFLKNVEKNG
jgi:predicted metalloprotease with PDZ domain